MANDISLRNLHQAAKAVRSVALLRPKELEMFEQIRTGDCIPVALIARAEQIFAARVQGEAQNTYRKVDRNVSGYTQAKALVDAVHAFQPSSCEKPAAPANQSDDASVKPSAMSQSSALKNAIHNEQLQPSVLFLLK